VSGNQSNKLRIKQAKDADIPVAGWQFFFWAYSSFD
jgi:hypothetical protein